MVALPARPEQQVITRIYNSYEVADRKPEIYLGRIGASVIGQECMRSVWLEWRAFARKAFEGRMLRLFETGHQQEARVVADLRAAGLSVWATDEAGKQFEYGDKSGHFVTKIDGVVRDVPESEKTAHMLEAKSHNKDSFAGLVKNGVQKSKPQHYAQMQISMKLAKMKRALYVAINKDNEAYHIERIKEDPEEQARVGGVITKMLEARLRPAGISDNIDSFACKFCDMKQVCYGKVAPLKNCRTCEFAEPGKGGEWVCTMKNETLTFDAQRLACDEHKPL